MSFRFLSRVLSGGTLLVLMGCASIVPPTGGPKDETPPQLLNVVPADSQVFLRPSRLDLQFDEYVEVREARTQIQISPLLDQPLSATLQGKRVRIALPDTLLEEETTYRIHFGEAIRDLNEGNPMAPYVYTFSTGGHFDSLVLQGTVVDARWGIDDSTASVQLYPGGLADSLWLRVRPQYVARVQDGRFRLEGLPDRPFLIMALRDANDNRLYDAEGEAIGFLAEPQRPQRPGEVSGLEILLFEEGDPEKTKGDAQRKGIQKGKRGTEAAAKEVPLDFSPQVDTSDLMKRTQEVTRPLEILFTYPPDQIHESRLRVYRDSLGELLPQPFAIRRDTADSSRILVDLSWKEDQVYVLGFQSGLAVDSLGKETPAKRYRFRTKRASDYGTLRLELTEALVDKGYLLRLDRGEDSFSLSPVNRTVFEWAYLEPGPYRFYLIEDRNGNGIWDTGDLKLRRQPERAYPLGDPIELKAGWELQFVRDTTSLPQLFPPLPSTSPADTLETEGGE